MKYDKASGQVTIQEVKKEKRVIENVNDAYLERMKLHKELGLDEDGKPIDENLTEDNVEELAAKLRKAAAVTDQEAEVDPA